MVVQGIVICILCNNTAAAGELDPKQAAWHKKYKQQKNAPQPDEMLLNEDAEPDLTAGFRSLFNGKDLTGWTPRGGTCTFEAKDGHIVGVCAPDSSSTYLCTDAAHFKDFVFTCEMMWQVDANSGVMFRAQVKPGKDNAEIVFGPQAEMEGFQRQDRGWSGGIYGQSCGGFFYPLWLKEHQRARAALKKGSWNRLTISAQGNVVKTWVNGVPAAHGVDDGSFPQGFFGLQIHKGAQGTILWRNLSIKEINPE